MKGSGRFPSKAGLASIKRDLRKVKTIVIAEELKFRDNGLVNSLLDTNTNGEDGLHNPTAAIAVTGIAQGQGPDQREGRRATWYSLAVRGHIEAPAQAARAATDDATNVFIAVVLDSQTNGAFAASELVYGNPVNSISTSTHLFRNLDNSKRFRVLATRHLTINTPNMVHNGTNIDAGGAKRAFNFYIKFKKPITANYVDTTTAISDQTDYSISIMAWVDSLQLLCTISYNTRLRFRG